MSQLVMRTHAASPSKQFLFKIDHFHCIPTLRDKMYAATAVVSAMVLASASAFVPINAGAQLAVR
jgi:hypothetical protein